MIVDFHTHVFPEEICSAREKYFPSESAFKLLYDSSKSKLITAEQLIRSMDQQKVDVSVIFGFPWKDSEIFRRNNDYIINATLKYPGRLYGLCCLDPFNLNALKEVERCFKAGLYGVGELAFYQSGIDKAALDQLSPIMQFCRENKRLVLIHTNEPVGHTYPGKSPNTLVQIYSLLKRFHQNKIVLAHWGGGIFFYNLLKKETKEIFKNVYFDTAASLFLYDTKIYSVAVDTIGADKILFGSDYPLIKPEKYLMEIEKSGLTKEDILKICGLNAKKLLNL